METEKSEGKWIVGQPWPNPALKARLPWCLRTRSMTRQQAVNAFRWTALAEAVSYLVLLGLAMPLKYLWQMPLAVKIIGSIHGALFVASLLPLVPFWLDRRVKSWAEDAA